MNENEIRDRLFVGVMATGISYADRKVERHGDYKRRAHLFFSDLRLEIEKDTPKEMADYIRKEAAKIQARKGEKYQISSSGQTITLGHGLEK